MNTRAPRGTVNLIGARTQIDVSCRNPFDNYGEEFDRAADKHFRSSRRPIMDETIGYCRDICAARSPFAFTWPDQVCDERRRMLIGRAQGRWQPGIRKTSCR